MSLQLGIVGLPNSGKSTLFNALTRAGAAVAPYPFTTIDPNVGIATLADSRLMSLAEMVQPERVIPAAVEFLDIAGLVRDAHKGEGLGNRFLSHIRSVDAVVMVLRCFQDPDVPHVYGRVDPLEDLDILDLELALADLSSVERRLEKTRTLAKAVPREYGGELAALESLRDFLQAGLRAAHWASDDSKKEMLDQWTLLTAKPRLLVANISEAQLPGGGHEAERVALRASTEGSEATVVCAQIEADLIDWSPEDADLYLGELGVSDRALDRLVAASFRLLDLITFFTITGGHEVRSWSVRTGTTAPIAASKIHTDMERGFIRAEAIRVDELLQFSSWAAARAAGQIRVEGRDYRIQDGDVIHFRFNV